MKPLCKEVIATVRELKRKNVWLMAWRTMRMYNDMERQTKMKLNEQKYRRNNAI